MDRTKQIKRKASDIDENSEPALKKPDIDDEQIDEISDIIKKYPTRRDFRTYLESIDKKDVIAEFLGVVFGYGDRRHCLYCHQDYDALNNSGCVVKHFGEEQSLDEPDEEYNDVEMDCYGQRLNYIDHEEFLQPPREQYPNCYEGRHWDTLIVWDPDEDDSNAEFEPWLSADNGICWWDEIEKPRARRRTRKSCEEMKCAKKI